ncbi:histidine kinase [Streptomyces sp. ISL-11]|uniref:sensor histidine kinase n=1 Tax=Streptomyces sp. ISL-11 TaxID=2819174 RepID=UPI001BEC644C|nr:histidine kinase [Streptomyces sp. ISL-11]MBT2383931.1 two-component sensor histidine kinase [Streptomyces sp. ISL-11]
MQSAVAVLGFLNLLAGRRPSAPDIVLYLAAFVAVFILQAVHCAPRAERFRARHGRRTLALQALLTYAPLLALGLTWAGMPGFLAGSALLILEPPLSFAAFGVAAALTGLCAMLAGQQPLGIAIGVLSCGVNGLMVYGVTRMASWSAEVRRARDEVARLAVEGERLRVARDLHDLLGYSLSAITLKGELVARLFDKDAARAHAELREVLDISRQALADVRCVANGYRQLSLTAELDSAARVLSTAGLAVEVHDERLPLREGTGTVLATVVREGVTNILRHSAAQRCRIAVTRTAGRLVLDMASDGIPADTEARMARRTGGGLDNLARRLEEIGGTFRAYADEEGWFRLFAECPADPAGPPWNVSESSPSPWRSGRRPAGSVR